LAVHALRARSLTPFDTARCIHIIQDDTDLSDRLVALWDLRNGHPDPAEVLPPLLAMLDDSQGKDAQEQHKKDILRRTALEVIAQMRGPAAAAAVPRVLEIVRHEDLNNPVTVQAVITLGPLLSSGSNARASAAELVIVMEHSRVPTPFLQETAATLADIGFEARGALGTLLDTMDGRDPDPSRFAPAAEAFTRIAQSLQERVDGLHTWEFLTIDGEVRRALITLKRSGSNSDLQMVRDLEPVQSAFDSAYKRRSLLSFSLRILSEVEIAAAVYAFLLLIVCALYLLKKNWLIGLNRLLMSATVEQFLIFKFRRPIIIGKPVAKVFLVSFFAGRAGAPTLKPVRNPTFSR
jgi:HEAT repeat protein